jgi:hypothetical protein
LPPTTHVAKIATIDTKQGEYNRRLRKTSKWFKRRILTFFFFEIKHSLAQNKLVSKN